MPSVPWPAATAAGATWLTDRRRRAAARFEAASLPTSAEEIWRYGRIGELDLDAYTPVEGPGPTTPALHSDALAAERAATITVRDGHLVDVVVAADLAGGGLSVGGAELAEGRLGAAMGEPVDAFALLNDALVADPVVVSTAPGLDLGDRPVVVRFIAATGGALVAPRLVVDAGAGSTLAVVEEHASAAVRALSCPVTELNVGERATLDHVVVQDLAPTVWQLGSQVSAIHQGATLRTACVGLGGDYARLRIETRMVGAGSRGDILAVYFGRGDQTLDFRTVQDHLAPKSASDLLFKGAVDDRSQSIYTGNIRIAKDAAGVDAFQTNRTVKLSPDAWAESVPNLEIENNDVRCSHASAIGPIDEEHLFYLESRGVRPEVAERLIVLGFLADVLERLPDAGLSEHLVGVIADRLEAS